MAQVRSKMLKYCLFLAVGVIALRLFFIQIVEHETWAMRAEEQQTMMNVIVAKRGEIYMMDGQEAKPVVMNETVFTLIVDPALADEEKVKEVVDSHAKEKRVAEWGDVFADKTRRYYIVARGVKLEEAETIRQAELAGVWFLRGTQRVYPEGELASGMLGFVNADGEGQYGVEGSLNKELAGENGVLKTIKDANNVPLTIGSDNVRVPAKDGTNLVLSVDRNVQRRAETALMNGLKRTGASNASAVVMEPTTGRILAMANVPTYDPAKYTEVTDASVFLNSVLDTAYEPASVCKTFTFAAAIDKGVMKPTSTYVNTGSVTVDGWPIANAHEGQLGTITMQTALSWSLNTGSIQALRWLGGDGGAITYQGKQALYDYYYNHFGLGQSTGVELAESTGLIIPPDTVAGTDARYANMTFGQGINLTMLQVAAGFSSVVNGGDYYAPTVIGGEMVNGKFLAADLKDPVRQTVSEDTSRTMREMLHEARLLYGDSKNDKAGYYIGGKTGTAQVLKNGEYVMDETVASYVGYGSASKEELPEYVIMVKIWREGGAYDGGEAAMPIFTELSNYMIDYLRMKPGEANE